MDGTPGNEKTFSTLKPGAPLVGFKIKFAFSSKKQLIQQLKPSAGEYLSD